MITRHVTDGDPESLLTFTNGKNGKVTISGPTWVFRHFTKWVATPCPTRGIMSVQWVKYALTGLSARGLVFFPWQLISVTDGEGTMIVVIREC